MIIDAKDLFDKNYQNEKIMHIIINNYIFLRLYLNISTKCQTRKK